MLSCGSASHISESSAQELPDISNWFLLLGEASRLRLLPCANLNAWRVASQMLLDEPRSFGKDLDLRWDPCCCIVAGGGPMCTKVFLITPPMHPSSETDSGAMADHFGTRHSAFHLSMALSPSSPPAGSSGHRRMQSPN